MPMSKDQLLVDHSTVFNMTMYWQSSNICFFINKLKIFERDEQMLWCESSALKASMAYKKLAVTKQRKNSNDTCRVDQK